MHKHELISSFSFNKKCRPLIKMFQMWIKYVPICAMQRASLRTYSIGFKIVVGLCGHHNIYFSSGNSGGLPHQHFSGRDLKSLGSRTVPSHRLDRHGLQGPQPEWDLPHLVQLPIEVAERVARGIAWWLHCSAQVAWHLKPQVTPTQVFWSSRTGPGLNLAQLGNWRMTQLATFQVHAQSTTCI